MNITRRTFNLGLSASTFLASTRMGWAQTALPPIKIIIHQAPYLDGIINAAAQYTAETGNQVTFDVNPFAGSLEKQRNSVRAAVGETDLLIMNSGWFAEMYVGGFVEAITDIDPGFALDPAVFTLDDTIYFDAEKRAMTKSGKLMSLPLQPTVPILFYRGDLYAEAGLAAPSTFSELEANARRFHKPSSMYGLVQRGARGAHTVAFEYYPYLYGHGGGIFKNQNAGDYTVSIGNAQGREALEYWLRLSREAGHPQSAALDQAEVVQNMAAGRAAHIMVTAGAAASMDDPNQSAVVDKIEFAPAPHAEGLPSRPGLGHWLAGVARNIPDDRKRAAVEFLRWFQGVPAQLTMAKGGAIPINRDVYTHADTQDRRYRWMKPLADSVPTAANIYNFPESGEVISILELELNRAIAGEINAQVALDTMSRSIEAVMRSHGYNTGIET